MNVSTLAANIRHFRKKIGLTQLQLAERLYIAPQTVSKWESGISEPDAERLCLLADIFNVSIDSLLRASQAIARTAFIAVDGGGTKTDFVLFLESGEIIKRVTLDGCNPNAVGVKRTVEILFDGIEKLLSNDVRVVGLFAGIAGAGVGDHRTVISGELHARYPYMKVRTDSDIVNVINNVKGVERCIAVISGTGSSVFGYDGTAFHRVGGWGYLFDEAGSGFDIGRDALRYCLGAEEGEFPMCEMYNVIKAAVGGRVLDKLDKIYASGKDYIASFAPLVFKCYEDGMPAAQKIIVKTADRLADLINRSAKRGDVGSKVIIAGGITSQRKIIEPLLRARLDDGLELVFPTMPQIYGAAAKCMELFSQGYDADTFEINFYNTINNK